MLRPVCRFEWFNVRLIRSRRRSDLRGPRDTGTPSCGVETDKFERRRSGVYIALQRVQIHITEPGMGEQRSSCPGEIVVPTGEESGRCVDGELMHG